MPKTPVYKYNLLQPREDEIRSSWQGFAMKTKAISQTMRHAAYNHFGLRVG
jgi:hypothetical protein